MLYIFITDTSYLLWVHYIREGVYLVIEAYVVFLARHITVLYLRELAWLIPIHLRLGAHVHDPAFIRTIVAKS
jgi:hypothetical protein